jgi:hypothetical protein
MVDVGLAPGSKRGSAGTHGGPVRGRPRRRDRARPLEGIHGEASGPLERAQHDRD